MLICLTRERLDPIVLRQRIREFADTGYDHPRVSEFAETFPIWRSYSKIYGYVEASHTEKKCGFKNFRIRVDGALFHFVQQQRDGMIAKHLRWCKVIF